MREHTEEAHPGRAALLAEYQAELEQIGLACGRGMYGRGEASIRTAERERARIQTLIDQLPPEPELPSDYDIKSVLTLSETWAEATAEERNRVLRSVIAGIYITRDGGAPMTRAGRPRVRGRQSVVSLEPLPGCALLLSLMLSETKSLLARQKRLPVAIVGAGHFRGWLEQSVPRARAA